MSVEIARVKDLFTAASEIADAAERHTFLDRKCGTDIELRRRLDELLRAHEHPAAAVESPLVPAATHSPRFMEATEKAGQILAGRYKLLEELGEGGMGTVWVAEQIEPVRRRVALKLIKAGMDSRSVLSRFEAERQALAVMDNPNIAKVLDGGMTAAGRPFFVMEYVKGMPITQYCDESRLSIEDRLNLFVPVCQAVQHAHQKGILHRDLKPSNILICMYDGRPVPKIIDFGLAKAIHQPLSDGTIYTGHAIMLGTPLYMSPEQAEINNLDIDTRSDVYSLGVVLYELLTGTTPLEKQRFRDAAWQEMMRLIKEEEPPVPSSRLSESGSLPGVAAQRHVEPAQLTRLVKGELDWIVMKCLEKDRSRRYESAISLCRDVERYLADDVVLARPPSAAYRWGKFIRRNRTQVLAVATVLLALVIGLFGTIAGLHQARAERQKALKAALAEKNARILAERHLNQLARNNDLLSSIFQDLDIQRIKHDGESVEAVLGERLESAAEQIKSDAVGDSLVAADLQTVLAKSLLELGHYAAANSISSDARTTYARLLGTDHRKTLVAMNNEAAGYSGMGKEEQASAILSECLALSESTLGRDHPDTMDRMSNLARSYYNLGRFDLALPLFQQALELRETHCGPQHPDTLGCMSLLAACYADNGQRDLALPLFQTTFELREAHLGRDHPDTMLSLGNLAAAYAAQGDLDRATPLLEESLRRKRRKLGEEHMSTLTAMINLAMAYKDQDKLDEAMELFEKTVRLLQSELGADHPLTLTAMHNKAGCQAKAGRLELAIAEFERVTDLRETKLGRLHPDTQQSIGKLGAALRKAGRWNDAIPLLEEAWRNSQSRPALEWTGQSLFETLTAAGNRERAIELIQEMEARAKSSMDADSALLGEKLSQLGSSCFELDAQQQAKRLLRESLQIAETAAPDAWTTFRSHATLGLILYQQQKLDEAVPALVIGAEGLLQRMDVIPHQVRQGVLSPAVETLVELLTDSNQPAELEKWTAVKERLSNQSEDDQ